MALNKIRCLPYSYSSREVYCIDMKQISMAESEISNVSNIYLFLCTIFKDIKKHV